MGTFDVVFAYPLTDHDSSVVDAFESVKPDALLFERADEAFAHSVLLRSVRSDVFLLKAVLGDGGTVEPGAEDQPVVVTDLQALGSSAQPAKAAD